MQCNAKGIASSPSHRIFVIQASRSGSKTQNNAMWTYLLLGLADDGREHRLGAILTGDSGLAATGAIVDDNGGLRNVDRHDA